MPLNLNDCCILNSGAGAWAFEPLAEQLAAAFGIEISQSPRRFNFLLHVEDHKAIEGISSFIPIQSMRLASDKRLLAEAFNAHDVPTPQTRLIDTFAEVQKFIRANPSKKWCLKFPTSCGANGHRNLTIDDPEPANWPKPYIVQEFIELTPPEVYRTYCAGGKMFGWMARRFPKESKPSPWVAHAKGARYVRLDAAPAEASQAAHTALVATGLLDSFGCVDLLQRPAGEWVVLEVGTDGLYNHVDREIGDSDFEQEISERISAAFWAKIKAEK